MAKSKAKYAHLRRRLSLGRGEGNFQKLFASLATTSVP